MPRSRALDKIWITTLYSTMVLVARPKKMPHELTSLLVGKNITKVVEAMF
jgi:hypothetical protein